MEMLEEHPDFDFRFNLLSDFEYDTAVDVNDKLTEWVYYAALSVQLENWAEFIVYKSQQGEDIT